MVWKQALDTLTETALGKQGNRSYYMVVWHGVTINIFIYFFLFGTETYFEEVVKKQAVISKAQNFKDRF